MNKLIFVKKYAEANSCLQEHIHQKVHEDSLIAHHRYMELNIKLQNSEQVMITYDQLFQSNKEDPLIESLHITASYYTGTIDPLITTERINEYLKYNEKNSLLSCTLGHALEDQDMLNEAIQEYESCIYLDSSWYPGYFGLSQAYYKAGNKSKGDQYFYMFEEYSPYSVYGNFDTHLKLMQEYLSENKYEESTAAVTTLTEWWVDNKKYCPIEIQVFEALSLSVIEDKKNNRSQSDSYQKKYEVLSDQLLSQKNIDPQTLYFIAKILENFGKKDQALRFYQHSLKSDLKDPEMIQKIGASFFSKGDHESAEKLFEEAYKAHPNNQEIRFCRMVCKLKKSTTNVEEYLLGKERLKKLLQSNDNPTEILALLHSLYSNFQNDPEVNNHLGEIYYRLQNTPKAKEHFDRMYEDDKECLHTKINYANFLLDIDEQKEAEPIIASIEDTKESSHASKEILWLKSRLAYNTKNYSEAIKFCRKLAEFEPWSIQYLVLETLSVSLNNSDHRAPDKGLLSLYHDKESPIDWDIFQKNTRLLEKEKRYEATYLREKIYFLFTQGSKESITLFLTAASDFDPARATTELIRLINTNFDHPNIYFSLGILAKKQWLLESSTMWLNQCLHQINLIDEEISQALKAEVYLEIADNLVWSKQQPQKAIEYAKIGMELGHRDLNASYTVLAHSHILLGKMEEARTFLSRLDHRKNHEAVFLSGLVYYRDGSVAQAKKIWKPLLTIPANDIKLHRLKTELMQYYYDSENYAGQSVS